MARHEAGGDSADGKVPSCVILVSNSAFGLYNFRAGVIRSLLASGCRVVAVAPRDSFSEALERQGVLCEDIALSPRGINPLAEALLFLRLIRIFRLYKPQAVFNYTIKPVIYGSWAAHWAGVPSVAVLTGLGYAFLHDSWIARVARGLLRLALHFALEVWVINADDGQTLRERGVVQGAKLRQLPGEGIDLAHFQPADWHVGAEVSLLLIGRMLRDKGVVEFVSAARRLKPRYPHVRFQLLGPADAQNLAAITLTEIQGWVAQGHVEYLGATDDVRPYIQASDCIVLPSYREGLPRVLMEAAAMARPVVVADSSGCREAVEPGRTGLLCRAGDAEDLTQKLEHMIQMSRSERVAMGRRGREFVEAAFDERIVIAVYEDFLARLVVRRSSKNEAA